jgi:hypothetical protein
LLDLLISTVLMTSPYQYASVLDFMRHVIDGPDGDRGRTFAHAAVQAGALCADQASPHVRQQLEIYDDPLDVTAAGTIGPVPVSRHGERFAVKMVRLDSACRRFARDIIAFDSAAMSECIAKRLRAQAEMASSYLGRVKLVMSQIVSELHHTCRTTVSPVGS